ncbi:MAG: DUF4214 domain-containing protein [Bdellovibrionales bacterium]
MPIGDLGVGHSSNNDGNNDGISGGNSGLGRDHDADMGIGHESNSDSDNGASESGVEGGNSGLGRDHDADMGVGHASNSADGTSNNGGGYSEADVDIGSGYADDRDTDANDRGLPGEADGSAGTGRGHTQAEIDSNSEVSVFDGGFLGPNVESAIAFAQDVNTVNAPVDNLSDYDRLSIHDLGTRASLTNTPTEIQEKVENLVDLANSITQSSNIAVDKLAELAETGWAVSQSVVSQRSFIDSTPDHISLDERTEDYENIAGIMNVTATRSVAAISQMSQALQDGNNIAVEESHDPTDPSLPGGNTLGNYISLATAINISKVDVNNQLAVVEFDLTQDLNDQEQLNDIASSGSIDTDSSTSRQIAAALDVLNDHAELVSVDDYNEEEFAIDRTFANLDFDPVEMGFNPLGHTQPSPEVAAKAAQVYSDELVGTERIDDSREIEEMAVAVQDHIDNTGQSPQVSAVYGAHHDGLFDALAEVSNQTNRDLSGFHNTDQSDGLNGGLTATEDGHNALAATDMSDDTAANNQAAIDAIDIQGVSETISTGVQGIQSTEAAIDVLGRELDARAEGRSLEGHEIAAELGISSEDYNGFIQAGGADFVNASDEAISQTIQYLITVNQLNDAGLVLQVASDLGDSVENPLEVAVEMIVTDVIRGHYTDILGRDADQEGLDAHVNSVLSGEQTVAQVRENIRYSDEGITKVIHDIYSDVLDRDIDVEGAEFWAAQLQSGDMTIEGVRNEIQLSEEGVSTFIDQVYENNLGRDADDAGKEFYTEQVNEGELQLFDVVSDVANSREANEVAINEIYANVLQREADDAGKEFYLDKVEAGEITLVDVVDDIASSREGVELQIEAIYQDVFERPVDLEGLEFYADKIEAGDITIVDVAQDVVASEEAVTNVIETVYQNALDRSADQEGLDHYVEQVQSGEQSLSDVVAEIAQSQEAVDAAEARQVEATQNAIQDVYQDVLDREADADGLEFYTNKVLSGEIDVAGVRADIAGSPEARGEVIYNPETGTTRDADSLDGVSVTLLSNGSVHEITSPNITTINGAHGSLSFNNQNGSIVFRVDDDALNGLAETIDYTTSDGLQVVLAFDVYQAKQNDTNAEASNVQVTDLSTGSVYTVSNSGPVSVGMQGELVLNIESVLRSAEIAIEADSDTQIGSDDVPVQDVNLEVDSGNVLNDSDGQSVGSIVLSVTSLNNGIEHNIDGTASFVIEGEFGDLTINPNGSFHYLIKSDAAEGVDRFTYLYRNTDGQAVENIISYDLADYVTDVDQDQPVNNGNGPVSDAGGAGDVSVFVSATNLSNGDQFEIDGNGSTYVIGSYGILSFNANGSIDYRVDADAPAGTTERFSYVYRNYDDIEQEVGLSFNVDNALLALENATEQPDAADARAIEVRGQIEGLYQEILERDADAPGLTFYLNKVLSGEINVSDVRSDLLDSDERRALEDDVPYDRDGDTDTDTDVGDGEVLIIVTNLSSGSSFNLIPTHTTSVSGEYGDITFKPGVIEFRVDANAEAGTIEQLAYYYRGADGERIELTLEFSVDQARGLVDGDPLDVRAVNAADGSVYQLNGAGPVVPGEANGILVLNVDVLINATKVAIDADAVLQEDIAREVEQAERELEEQIAIEVRAEVESQIGDIYVDLLEREADADGLEFYLNKVLSGEIDVAGVREDIMGSAEYLALQDNQSFNVFVQATNLLTGEVFELSEVNPTLVIGSYGVLTFNTNGTVDYRVDTASPAGTTERFTYVYKNYDNALQEVDLSFDVDTAIAALLDRLNDEDAFRDYAVEVRGQIEEVYIETLGREADQEGLEFYIGEVLAGDIDVAGVRADIEGSPEGQTVAAIRDLYLDVLGREADAEGLAFYVGKVMSGEIDVSDVRSDLLSSDERQAIEDGFSSDGSADGDSGLLAEEVMIFDENVLDGSDGGFIVSVTSLSDGVTHRVNGPATLQVDGEFGYLRVTTGGSIQYTITSSAQEGVDQFTYLYADSAGELGELTLQFDVADHSVDVSEQDVVDVTEQNEGADVSDRDAYISEIESEIEGIYQDVLERSADADGLEFYTNKVLSGEIDLEGVLNDILASPEAQNLIQADADVDVPVQNQDQDVNIEEQNAANAREQTEAAIEAIYRDVLERGADADGLEFYTDKVLSGEISVNDVRVDIYGSSEAQDLRQAEAAQRAAQEAAQQANQQAAERAAQEAAQRAAQEAAQRAAQEAAQRAAQEAAREAASDPLEALYQEVFGRASDAPGKAFWQSQIDNGMSISEVRGHFLSSPEYLNKTPLVLDLDGDGIELSHVEDGVQFDIDNDGIAEQTAWVKADDGLLALDGNNDGIINNQSELFGDTATLSDGFNKLAGLDSNQDGQIDSGDEAFEDLVVWQDHNQDGVSDSDELLSLQDLEIVSINLNADMPEGLFIEGNWISHVSDYVKADGSTEEISDVWFQYIDETSAATEEFIVTDNELQSETKDSFGAQGDVVDVSDYLTTDSGVQDTIDAFVFVTGDDNSKTDIMAENGGELPQSPELLMMNAQLEVSHITTDNQDVV